MSNRRPKSNRETRRCDKSPHYRGSHSFRKSLHSRSPLIKTPQFIAMAGFRTYCLNA